VSDQPPAGTDALAPSAASGLVDSHQHFWDLAAHDQPFLRLPGNEPLLRDFTEAELRPQAAAAGVTATVVVQTVTEPGETPEFLALADGSDLVAGVVGWVDLQADDVTDALAALQDRPDGDWLRGIRHPVLIEPDPDWLRRPAVQRGITAVGVAGLCYDLVLPSSVLPAAADAIAACPDVVFVLDHLGNPELGPQPDEQWADSIRQLAASPNTFCKLSGMLAEPAPDGSSGVAHLRPYYEIVLHAFGPDRLMFGSDWPPCTVTSSYGEVVNAAQALIADLSAAERFAIMAGTARRVYRLT
jgi:L-fuconolactonase